MARAPHPPAGRSTPADRRRAVREEQQRQAVAAKRRRSLIQAGIIAGVAVVVIAIVASAVIIGHRSQASRGDVPSVDSTVAVDNVSVPFAVAGSAVRVGPADAKARIDLWVDYSCPHCQEFEADNNTVLNQLIAAGNVSVSYHNIQIVTDYGTAAGSAAACVATADPAKWVAFNSSLYANHNAETDGWSAADFRTFAGQQGVNDAAMACITADRYSGWIAANTADAARQNVNSTPTMLINGQATEPLTGQDLISKVNQLAGR
jgi:protein-disulfide isomerase